MSETATTTPMTPATPAPATEAAPPASAMERAIAALTAKPEAAPPTPPPAAPAPPTPPVDPPKAQPDPEAIRRTQERAHADAAAKLERDRLALEERAKQVAAQESAAQRAQRLERLAKDDPAAFLRETGQDPVRFAQRLAERERLSEVARAELDGTSKEVAALKAELDRIKAEQQQGAQQAQQAARAQSLAELRAIAGAKHPAAAHFLKLQPDDPYVDDIADEIRRERGFVTLDAVAERLDLRVREQARTILESEWGRVLAAEVAKAAAPPAAAPNGQSPNRAAQAPKTLTRSVADDRATPPSDTSASRFERALDKFMGGGR